MTTPISIWIFAVILLGVVPGIFFYLLLAPWRELRKNQRDIFARGQAAIGTIVAITELYRGRAGITYGVTMEFTPPDYPEAIRVQINCGESDVSRLGVDQQVPIHFRESIPMEVVIDELAR